MAYNLGLWWFRTKPFPLSNTLLSGHRVISFHCSSEMADINALVMVVWIWSNKIEGWGEPKIWLKMLSWNLFLHQKTRSLGLWYFWYLPSVWPKSVRKSGVRFFSNDRWRWVILRKIDKLSEISTLYCPWRYLFEWWKLENPQQLVGFWPSNIWWK